MAVQRTLKLKAPDGRDDIVVQGGEAVGTKGESRKVGLAVR